MEERDDIPDQTRRRLMKLAAYIPAGIVSLSAVRAQAGRLDVTGAAKGVTSTSSATKFAGAWRPVLSDVRR